MMATRQVLTKLALASVLAAGGAFGFTSTAHAACVGGTPDGVWDPDAGEACDDGNNISGDGCENDCTVTPGYACDLSIPFESLDTWTYGTDDADWKPGFTSRQQMANTSKPTYAYMGINAADIGDTILELYVDQATYEGNGQGNPPRDDDDWVGFVLGFEPSTANTEDAEYLLIDWKAVQQRWQSSTYEPGLRLSVVKGIPALGNDSYGRDGDFWSKSDIKPTSKVRHVTWADGAHTNTYTRGSGNNQERAWRTSTNGGTYGSTGWKNRVPYQFRFEYRMDYLKVEVRETESGAWQTAFDMTPQDAGLDEFPNGQIGFYGLSQAYARYSLIDPLYSVCEEVCNDGILTGNEECENQDAGCNLNTCRWSVEITDPADQSYISENRPVISGEGSANANIRVTFTDENNNVLSTVNTTTDANGAWSATPDVDLPEGLIDVQVRQRDDRNSDTFDDISIQRLDLSVMITDPNDGETYGGPTYNGTVPVSGSATPGITSVTLYIDGADSGVTAPVDPTTHTWGPVNLPIGMVNGDYDVKAVGTGTNNITVDSQNIVLHVDADTFVTIDAPAHGSTHNTPVGSISGTGEPGADVSLTIENGETITTTVDNDGNWAVTLTTPLTNDTFTATATITDVLGNTDIDVSTFTVHIDACSAGTDTCDPNATCQDLGADGDYSCTCNTGYTGDGQSCHVTLNPIDDNLYLYVDGSRLFDPLLNDEGDIDPGTFQLVDFPQHGTITGPDATGFYNYVVEEHYVGDDTATYKICDVHGDCDTATLHIYIYDTFKPQDDEIIVLEGATTTFNPLDNDGSETDPATMEIVSGPSNGSLDGNDPAANGELTYTADTVGTDTITYKVCADDENCGEATITVTINDLPTLDDETRIVTPGGSQTIDIVASADPGQVGDIDASSAKLTSNASTPNGTCAVQNGKLTFEANADATLGASDTCTVEICEEQPDNACTSATYTFEIQDVFNPTEDELSTTQDTPMAFIPDDLLQNDGNTDDDSFEIVFDEDPENPGVITTTEGGTITYDDTTGEYTYAPPADFTGEDSFTYNVCSGLPNDDTCDEVDVTIVVHDLPTVEDTTIWVVTDTPSVDVPVQDLYSGGPIGSITPGAVEDEDGNPVGTVTVDGPTNTLTFTPNDPSAPGIYTFDAEVCDEADVCETMTITVIYNDPPNTQDPEIIVEPGTDKPVSFEELTRNSDKGDVDGGWDESSILVSNDPNGPFGQDADLGDDNACAIIDGELVYTLAEEVALGDNAPTCFIQICELDPGPAGTDTTNRACSVLDMTPTAGIEIVITGPQDGETLEADEPVTVTGTGEPNTEVTITIDGEDVGTTTVDEDGNWEFPLEEPLSPGDHTIVAEGENGSTDQVTIHVKDPADAETSIVINGPADGSTVPPNVTVHGKAEPFTPVKIFVDGEEVGTVTTDGKGAWTFDLTDLELGEHTITAEDRNGDTDEVKVTVKDEDGEGDGNGDGEGEGEGLDGPDPNVAVTGGRFLSCAATEPGAPTGGLVLLTLVVAALLARRRREEV